jgi:hypothetical protein
MFTMEIDQLICFLKRCEDDTKHWKFLEYQDLIIKRGGLLISLDLELYNHKAKENRRVNIYFLLCGDTTVFVSTSKQTTFPDLKTFENISTHPSCWKDAIRDYLLNLYFTWSDEIKGDLKPCDLRPFLFSINKELVCITYRHKDDKNVLLGVVSGKND